jgi:hypothetical protein
MSTAIEPFPENEFSLSADLGFPGRSGRGNRPCIFASFHGELQLLA